MSYKTAGRMSKFTTTRQDDKSGTIFLLLFLKKMFKILSKKGLGNVIVREAAENAFIRAIIRAELLREAGVESSF